MSSGPSALCTWHKSHHEFTASCPGNNKQGAAAQTQQAPVPGDFQHPENPVPGTSCHWGRAGGCPSTKQVPATSSMGRDHTESQPAANSAAESSSCVLLRDAQPWRQCGDGTWELPAWISTGPVSSPSLEPGWRQGPRASQTDTAR